MHDLAVRTLRVYGRWQTIRPEIRQYLVESDTEAVPFSRLNRSVVYQRAKAMTDTTPFGTRQDVYQEGCAYLRLWHLALRVVATDRCMWVGATATDADEWINHSIFPEHVSDDDARVTIGGKGCTQPYSAALLNISAMSFGALSENAILALNSAAKSGNFYHNTGAWPRLVSPSCRFCAHSLLLLFRPHLCWRMTGEGGVSEYHKRPGGDIVRGTPTPNART